MHSWIDVLYDDEILEECTVQVRIPESIRCRNISQPSGETCVRKIKNRGQGEVSLASVPKICGSNWGYYLPAFCQHTNARFSSENTAAARISGFADEAP